MRISQLRYALANQLKQNSTAGNQPLPGCTAPQLAQVRSFSFA